MHFVPLEFRCIWRHWTP